MSQQALAKSGGVGSGRLSPGKFQQSLLSLSSEDEEDDEDDSPLNRMMKEDSQWGANKKD